MGRDSERDRESEQKKRTHAPSACHNVSQHLRIEEQVFAPKTASCDGFRYSILLGRMSEWSFSIRAKMI